ncbi:diguanylate cyclase [Agarivorans sp. MS3-6]
MKSRFFKKTISWKQRASIWTLLVVLLFSAVVYHRFQTVKQQIVEEIELSFTGFSTANKHLVSLLSQRLSLLTRTLGLLNYVNNESELTLVTLATEWQRIAKDINLEGNFYYIHRDGRVDLALNQYNSGHKVKWGAKVNPAVISYFKGVGWRNEGQISSKVINDYFSENQLYLIYTPVFDKWSKLTGWMVNEYNQASINETVHFVGRPRLVERAIILTDEGVIVEGDYSQDTRQKLMALVGRFNYFSIQRFFASDMFDGEQAPFDVGTGLMFVKRIQSADKKPNLTYLYISYEDLAESNRYWLVFIAIVFCVAILSCFIGAYLTDVIRREKAIIEELNALREAAFEGEFSQVITNTEGIVLQTNRYFSQLVGVPKTQMLGKYLTDFGHSEPDFKQIMLLASEQGSWSGEIKVEGLKGKTSIQQLTVTAVYWQNQLHNFVCSSVDISAQKSLENELKKLANTDPLTKAANRRHFEDSTHLEQSRSERNGSLFSILMLDVDHFKQLNDQYGHDVGDECLIRLVETVNHLKRDTDLLARWGGEEFIMLLPETDAQQALNLAERLRLAFVATSKEPSFTCSFGVTESHKEQSFANLYKQADDALYAAKARGRNQVVLYSSELKNS